MQLNVNNVFESIIRVQTLIFCVITLIKSISFSKYFIHNAKRSFYRKDVRLPVQLQRAMAAEAEAAREARAKVYLIDRLPIKDLASH